MHIFKPRSQILLVIVIRFMWNLTAFFFQECCLSMPLSQIIFFEEQAAGIGKRSVAEKKFFNKLRLFLKIKF